MAVLLVFLATPLRLRVFPLSDEASGLLLPSYLPPARFRAVLSEHEMPYHLDLRLANLGHLGSCPSFLRRAAQFVSLVGCVPSCSTCGSFLS